DCAMTEKLKYEKKAIKMSLVKGTWKKVLKDEHALSKDWPREVGVLVGWLQLAVAVCSGGLAQVAGYFERRQPSNGPDGPKLKHRAWKHQMLV
ncbi:hypothetical protein C8R47DRAFT_994902, partial [Mycena vitilis]